MQWIRLHKTFLGTMKRTATLLKKRLWYRCFPVNFAKFLRTPFLQNTSGRLLLTLITITKFIKKPRNWRVHFTANAIKKINWLTKFKVLSTLEAKHLIHQLNEALMIFIFRSNQWRCSEKFRKFHRKTTVLESLFNKVAGLKACNFIEKRAQYRCSLWNLQNF